MADTTAQQSTQNGASVTPAPATTSVLRESTEPVRESPAPEPLQGGLKDPSHPDVAAVGEPQIDVGQVQGNILGGFSKDHQILLALTITDPALFKQWLHAFVPLIATSAEVIAFNRLFKEIRSRRGEPTGITATWINIAFSALGLQQLGVDTSGFLDTAFTDGLQKRSLAGFLGDPKENTAEGNANNWVFGGPGKEAHVLLIIASDLQKEAHDTANQIEASLAGSATLVFREEGNNLPAPLAGHEHFGFLDGVSQPGVRGRLSQDPHDVLTLRQNPNDRTQGKPGQDALWPGLFVFGYPTQNPTTADTPGPIASAGPVWADNGSFLVLRRLRQDVNAFHTFLNQQGAAFSLSPRLVGSRLVGRWSSGAPVMRTLNSNPTANDVDDPALAGDDCANNNFDFQDATPQIPAHTALKDPFDCTDVIPGSSPLQLFQTSQGDSAGLVCPFSAHIRKAYPRDDVSINGATRDGQTLTLNEDDTETHRILRRGIPFGRVSASTPENPVKDDPANGRGLHFLAYQTSITNQFEFIQSTWANNPDFKEPFVAGGGQGEAQGGGHDPIIGQNDKAANRERFFTISFTDGAGNRQTRQVSTTTDWVIPTGGGYFFAPSIDALKLFARS